MTTGNGSPKQRALLFGKVYKTAQHKVRPILQALMQTLREMGCGPGGRHETFEEVVRRVLVGFAHGPASAPQFSALRLPPTPETRTALIASFLYRLGMDKDRADRSATRVMSLPAASVGDLGPMQRGRVSRNSQVGRERLLESDIRHLFGEAQDLYERLDELHKKVGEPYRGSSDNHRSSWWGKPSEETFADRGVEQTVELLQMFPDLADPIYVEAGLKQVTGFPPGPKSPSVKLTGDDAEFVNHVDEFLDEEATWAIISAVGLIAAGIVLTVVTAGVAGAVAGMVVGAGTGLVHGGVMVADAHNDLHLARDSHRAGAGGEARVAFLEGELQGAWGMLLADVVSGGLLGRVGGASGVMKVATAFKTIAISGAGTGIGTATNPNVWASDDVAGILIKATVMGAVAGGAGAAAGGLLARAGNRVMIGLSRQHGELKVGTRVTLASQGSQGEAHMMGEVVSVSGDRIRIVTPHGEVNYTVNDVAIVRTMDGSPAPKVSPDREGTSLQAVVEPTRAPRVQNQSAFSNVRDLEAPALKNPAALEAMSDADLMTMSSDLMPKVQAELARLGYKTKVVPVDHQGGGTHMALELLEAPGRLGTLMRRAGPAMDSDVKYIYDPVGLSRDGGSGLFDKDLNAVRFGHGIFSNAHNGVVAPFFHELRHGRTAIRLGDADYPYHGTFYFDRNTEMGSVSAAYRDQFQVDEMYAYLKQAASTAHESRRANTMVQQQGRDALQDPRTKTFFGQGPRIGQGEALTAKGFAKAVKTQAKEFLDALRNNGSRVKTEALDNGDFPSTAHRFHTESGQEALHIEYWTDSAGMRNGILVRTKYNADGTPMEEGQVALHFLLDDAPQGYKGDASHGFIVRRLEGMLAASDDVIARAMRAQDQAEETLDAARAIQQNW
jgi:hypothetical protein